MKEALAVFCFVIKYSGSGESTQEVGRNTRLRLVFFHTLLSYSRCFLRALFKQNRAQLRLLYLLNNGPIIARALSSVTAEQENKLAKNS